MPASINDLITDVRNNQRPNSATVTTARIPSGTNLACDSLAGWPTASKVHFVVYQTDTNDNVIAGTQLDCAGIVSANTITNLVVLDGTDGGNSVGDKVEMLPTASWAQDLADGLMESHNRDGTLRDGSVDSPDVLTSNTITTAKIVDDAVTADKLASSAVVTDSIVANAVTNASVVWNNVAFSGQTISSTSFVDVTLATGSFTTTGGTLFLVGHWSGFANTTNMTLTYKVLIGATDVPNSTGWFQFFNLAANHTNMPISSVVTGVVAGTYTVKLQAKVNTSAFLTDLNDRCHLSVIEFKK